MLKIHTQISLENTDIHSWLKCYCVTSRMVLSHFCTFYNISSHDDCPITFRSVPPPFWTLTFNGGWTLLPVDSLYFVFLCTQIGFETELWLYSDVSWGFVHLWNICESTYSKLQFLAQICLIYAQMFTFTYLAAFIQSDSSLEYTWFFKQNFEKLDIVHLSTFWTFALKATGNKICQLLQSFYNNYRLKIRAKIWANVT